MKTALHLHFDPPRDLWLRSIATADCETLRQWKNANRHAFFFQGTISPEDQMRWFAGYLERPHDYLFMVCVGPLAMGCMGFRVVGGEADIYNVMRGQDAPASRGFMSQAAQLMCSFIVGRFTRRVSAKVLRSNPAIEWYRGNGFEIVAEADDHVVVQLDHQRFEPLAMVVEAADPEGDRS
jgi:ribosomal protein S18 acetylase RimI-like enzyme